MSEVKHINEFENRHQISVECAPLITERIMEVFTCQDCVIENYSKLSERRLYTMSQEMECIERTLKFYKTKNIHSFKFHCELKDTDIELVSGDLKDRMRFYILYEEDNPVWPGDLTETSYGFLIDIPTKLVTKAENKYLFENDKLVIRFTYRNYTFFREPIGRSGIRRNLDEEKLSSDLLALYESGKFTDFAIVDGEGEKHFVHRSICRSRSTTIDKIDDINVVAISVEGKSRDVERAIRYMYGGILPQLSLDDFLKLLKIAEELDIESLSKSIQQALLILLNTDNAGKITRATLKRGNMTQLSALALDLQPPQQRKKKKSRR